MRNMPKDTALHLPFSDFKESPIRASQASRLYVLSIAYFALPCFIFLAGFTKWYVMIVAGLCLAAAGYFDLKHEISRGHATHPWRRDVLWFLLIFAAACLWTTLFGAGFIGPQTPDQLKNHKIYHDLFQYAWPVIYPDMPPEMRFLSYPLGYYLTPAFIGKIFGWPIGTFSIFLWTSMGIALLWAWLYVLFARFAVMAIVVFTLFSGLDILGRIALNQGTPVAGSHLEWWSGWTFLHYSSNATVMSWSTQHGAAQWLFPMLLFYRLVVLKEVRGSALIVSIAAFWSHLTLLGAAVFLPLYFSEKKIKDVLKDPSLLALPFLALVAIFYASKAPGAIETGFIWDYWTMEEALPKLLWFYLFEFGILALFIYSIKQTWDRDEKLVFLSSTFLLLIIPIYHVGLSNDISMRVSAIPLFMLFIFFCITIRESLQYKNKPVLALAFLYVIVGSFTSGNEMFRQLESIFPTNFFVSDLTDLNWNRGVNRMRLNCFMTTVPRDFALKPGDSVVVKGIGSFVINEASANGGFQNLCISPTDAIVDLGPPVGPRSLRFFRNESELKDRFHIRTLLPPDKIARAVSDSPQQYTGTVNSLFFKYFLRTSTKVDVDKQNASDSPADITDAN